MHYYYVFNLSVLIILLYRVSIGWKGGLFNESTNIAAFFFSSGMSITFFERVGDMVNNYFCPDKNIAMLVSLWLIFMVILTVLWITKSCLMEKVFQSTREKEIPFPQPLNKLGGAVCGLVLGTLILSFFILSLHIAPLSQEFYEATHLKEGEVLLHVDEFLPRGYAAVVKKLPPPAGEFDWQAFLTKYRWKQEELEEQEGQPEQQESQEQEEENK